MADENRAEEEGRVTEEGTEREEPAPAEGGMEYESGSPDEEALVKGAGAAGVRLLARTNDTITLNLPPLPHALRAHGSGIKGWEANGSHCPAPADAYATHSRLASHAQSCEGGVDLVEERLGGRQAVEERLGGIRHTDAQESCGTRESDERYRILRVLDFTSERKRMSIVIERLPSLHSLHTLPPLAQLTPAAPMPARQSRGGKGGGGGGSVCSDGCSDGCSEGWGQGQVILVTKGADDAVLPLLRGGGAGAARLEDEEEEALVHLTQAQLDEFASFGLRTLLVAWRHMRREEYEEWESGVLREAEMSLEGREARVGAAYEALERGSVLIGATAIQDKLQPNVPATIGVLREAGISTWMVTGDKLSTAKQVGAACGLIRLGQELVTFDDPAKIDETLKKLAHALAYADGSGRVWRERWRGGTGETLGLVVVLTGTCLAAMSQGQLALFAEHAVHAQAGVCCRLTPDQKALLVNMLRHPQVQHQLILRRSREAAAYGDEQVFGVGKRWGHGWIEELERRVLGREAVICAIGQSFAFSFAFFYIRHEPSCSDR